MKSINSMYSRGFTLIELLVVIAIIGLLASVILASLQSARISARDSARVQSVKQIQNALEIYRNANNGQYPCSFPAPCTSVSAVNGVVRNTAFDAVIAPYYKAVTDSFVYNGTFFNNTILYRLGNVGASPNFGSYTILLRREGVSQGPAGTILPTAWCHVSMNLGHNLWTAAYPKCFDQ